MTVSGTNRVTAGLLVALIAVCGAAFLAWNGIDALEGRSEFHFFADSPTYHEAARGDLSHIESAADLLSVAGNFLGPLIILWLAGENYYAVLALNSIVLIYSTWSLSSTLRIDALRLAGWLLLNPITISSVLSVNKEILSLLFVALLMRGWTRQSWVSLTIALAISIMVRWQLTVAMVVLLAMLTWTNPFRDHRYLSLTFLLLLLSAAYVAMAPLLEPIRLNFEHAAAEYEGSGLYEQLVAWQDGGAYWAVFPLKAAHLLFGMGLRLDRLLAPENIYNDVWQLLHSTALLILFCVLLRQRRMNLRNDLVYVSAIYVAIFAITPIYTPRYFYPVYVLWVLALCARDPASVLLGLRGRHAKPHNSRNRPAAIPSHPHP